MRALSCRNGRTLSVRTIAQWEDQWEEKTWPHRLDHLAGLATLESNFERPTISETSSIELQKWKALIAQRSSSDVRPKQRSVFSLIEIHLFFRRHRRRNGI